MGQRVSLRGATAFETWDGGFLKMRDPQVTIGFNTKMVIPILQDSSIYSEIQMALTACAVDSAAVQRSSRGNRDLGTTFIGTMCVIEI